jgi:hypothetical protein
MLMKQFLHSFMKTTLIAAIAISAALATGLLVMASISGIALAVGSGGGGIGGGKGGHITCSGTTCTFSGGQGSGGSGSGGDEGGQTLLCGKSCDIQLHGGGGRP